MNLNNDPDKHLLDQIDKLLETHQPTGDKVLDELATSHPTPRPDFQNTLEQRLLARFEQTKQGKTPMLSASSSYTPLPASHRNWLPLTLLAALIVVAIAGVMLISGRGKSPTINEVALAQASTTPTITQAAPTQSVSMTTAVPPVSNANLSTFLPPNSVAISVPLQQLTQDSLIPGVGGGVDIVVILPFKASNPNLDVIPATAMPDGSRAVELTLVRDAAVLFHTPISQSNPPDASASITFAVSVEDSRQLAWMGEQPQVRIRLQKPVEHSVAADSGILLLPFDFVTADESLQTGDIVNIISTCAFVPDAIGNDVTASKTDCSQSSNQIRALNAQIMSGEILANDQSSVKTSNALSLTVPQDSLPMFAQMIDGRMHFKLVKSTAASQPTPNLEIQSAPTAAPEPVTPNSDAEKILMTIPRSDFIEVGPNVQEGEPADIVFSFFYLSRPDNSPDTPLKPSSQIRPVATKVDIIKIGGQNKEDEITLSVTRQQSVILQWALGTKLALSLTRIVFDIPLSLIDSSHDSIQVGDLVDVYSTCQLVADAPSSKVDCTRAVEQKDFVGTVVLLNDSLDQNRAPDVVTVSVALPPLPPDIQLRLSSMVAAGMHFKLVESSSSSQPVPTPPPTPQGTSPIEIISDIPLARIDSTSDPIQAGDVVDIYTTCFLAGDPLKIDVTVTQADCSQAVEEKETTGTVVSLDHNALEQNGTPLPATFSLALPADMQSRMSSLLMAGMHFKLVKSTAATQAALTPTPIPTSIPVPNGKVTFDLPRISIQPLAEGVTLNVGTHVDVIATLLSIDTDAPAKLQSIMTLQPGQTPDQLTQRVVHAALVVYTRDVYTLAVSPEEAVVLQQLIDAKIALTLKPVAPSEITFPAHVINLKLDSLSHWASDSLQVGDSVDVVVGMVLGDAQNPQLGFKPYSQYSFNDPLTSGLIIAQTYVQADAATSTGAMFLRRAVQNATIIALSTHKDPKSARAATFTLALELSSDTTADQSDFLTSYVATGMPYLVIKHESTN